MKIRQNLDKILLICIILIFGIVGYINKTKVPNINPKIPVNNTNIETGLNNSFVTKKNTKDENKEEQKIFNPNNEKKEELININKASKEELMTINGIGKKKAEDIIRYRKNTPFKKIEDIMNIKGFGKKIFEKIKGKIRV